MEMSPQRVRSAEFKSVRKGIDPDEVRAFLNEVADELERAQNQSTAMEARARAAVARLQEVGESAAAPAAAPAAKVDASVDESETISRTLLLAQRTADTTVAEAKSEAASIVSAANNEAATTLDSTREMAAQLLDEARTGARQAGETERKAVASEVEALKARREFLESDVEQLEIFLTEQRTRLRDAATSLIDVVERVPGGLGEVRAPLLSASDDDDADSGDPVATAIDPEPTFASSALETADDDPAGTEDRTEGVADDEPDDLVIVTDLADDEPDTAAPDLDVDPWSDADDRTGDPRDEPTEAIPVVESARTTDDSDGFRFSFDDTDR